MLWGKKEEENKRDAYRVSINIHMPSNELTYKWSIEKASPLRTHSSYIDGRLSHIWLLASHSFLIGK